VQSESSTDRLEPGTVVAERFVVDRSVGEGASGVVYAARRTTDGVRVALKVIHRSVCYDEQITRRFEREATILKHLEGNHIVRLLDVTKHDDLPVLVLEYVEGRALDAALGAGNPTNDQAVEITLQICAALGAAHAAGFVHRDLKPGNVIVQGDFAGGKVPMVWVVDFGLGKKRFIRVHPGFLLPNAILFWARLNTCRPSKLAVTTLIIEVTFTRPE
jgi:serine/threonine protein kinase